MHQMAPFLCFVALLGFQVLITDVEGPSDLNDKEWEVTVTGPYTFTINANTTNLPRYIRGGYVKPIKTGIVKDFLPLKEALLKPEAVLTDFSKEQMPCQLHVFFMALHQFITEYGAPPAPYDDDQVRSVFRALFFGEAPPRGPFARACFAKL